MSGNGGGLLERKLAANQRAMAEEEAQVREGLTRREKRTLRKVANQLRDRKSKSPQARYVASRYRSASDKSSGSR